jgi:predicted transcriptional regulator
MTTTTLTIKVSDSLHSALQAASRQARLTKSEITRRALAAYLAHNKADVADKPSALARAGDLVGCFEGGPKDLASNPRHMQGFGK